MSHILLQDKLLFPAILWARPQNIHKRAAGKVLVVAGSKTMAGAALLTAEAAYRAGVGVMILAYPQSLKSSFDAVLPEAMSRPLAETPSGSIALVAMHDILNACTDVDAVVVGPGLSRNLETESLVRALIERIEKPLIIDADALNALADSSDDPAALLRDRKSATVLTPHEGEMARLIRTSADVIAQNRIKYAEQYAQKWQVTLVLKGHGTVIAQVGREVIVNKSGTPALATAGTGDVLAGIIGAFVAQNPRKEFEASATAVYVHGKAAEEAEHMLGERSVMATDVIRMLPQALKALEE